MVTHWFLSWVSVTCRKSTLRGPEFQSLWALSASVIGHMLVAWLTLPLAPAVPRAQGVRLVSSHLQRRPGTILALGSNCERHLLKNMFSSDVSSGWDPAQALHSYRCALYLAS